MSGVTYELADAQAMATGAAVRVNGDGPGCHGTRAIVEGLADQALGGMAIAASDAAPNTAPVAAPNHVAPDSICYCSHGTGRDLSKASDDLALCVDVCSGKSARHSVSAIAVKSAHQLTGPPGVMKSFASFLGHLRTLGYADALPAA